jgi:hypothetical protein
MPKQLLERIQPDSIREFRSAASERYIDGEAAAKIGRRTAAIYLWGYSAEMTLKAAYFAAVGFSETRAITIGDLGAARNAGIASFHITWPNQGKFHNVRAWADLLVGFRSHPPGIAYTLPTFGDELKRRGRWIEPLWSETLRYHKNVAYPHEVERVRQATGWLLINSLNL